MYDFVVVADCPTIDKQWDEIVYAFCMGIPAKRRRKRLRVYEDCFTGRKAVDWMHNYLMFSSYFCKHEVSRFQAVQLLRKFMQHSIIQRADVRDTEIPEMMEFKDNRDLYTLSPTVAQVLPIHQPIPDDTDIGNLSMDLEAEPVAPCSSSSLPTPLHPPPPIPASLPPMYRSAIHPTLSPPAAGSLNCCANIPASSSLMTSMTRSPLKPVNRRTQGSVTAVARLRPTPVDDVFWL